MASPVPSQRKRTTSRAGVIDLCSLHTFASPTKDADKHVVHGNGVLQTTPFQHRLTIAPTTAPKGTVLPACVVAADVTRKCPWTKLGHTEHDAQVLPEMHLEAAALCGIAAAATATATAAAADVGAPVLWGSGWACLSRDTATQQSAFGLLNAFTAAAQDWEVARTTVWASRDHVVQQFQFGSAGVKDAAVRASVVWTLLHDSRIVRVTTAVLLGTETRGGGVVELCAASPDAVVQLVPPNADRVFNSLCLHVWRRHGDATVTATATATATATPPSRKRRREAKEEERVQGTPTSPPPPPRSPTFSNLSPLRVAPRTTTRTNTEWSSCLLQASPQRFMARGGESDSLHDLSFMALLANTMVGCSQPQPSPTAAAAAFPESPPAQAAQSATAAAAAAAFPEPPPALAALSLHWHSPSTAPFVYMWLFNLCGLADARIAIFAQVLPLLDHIVAQLRACTALHRAPVRETFRQHAFSAQVLQWRAAADTTAPCAVLVTTSSGFAVAALANLPLVTQTLRLQLHLPSSAPQPAKQLEAALRALCNPGLMRDLWASRSHVWSTPTLQRGGAAAASPRWTCHPWGRGPLRTALLVLQDLLRALLPYPPQGEDAVTMGVKRNPKVKTNQSSYMVMAAVVAALQPPHKMTPDVELWWHRMVVDGLQRWMVGCGLLCRELHAFCALPTDIHPWLVWNHVQFQCSHDEVLLAEQGGGAGGGSMEFLLNTRTGRVLYWVAILVRHAVFAVKCALAELLGADTPQVLLGAAVHICIADTPALARCPSVSMKLVRHQTAPHRARLLVEVLLPNLFQRTAWREEFAPCSIPAALMRAAPSKTLAVCDASLQMRVTTETVAAALSLVTHFEACSSQLCFVLVQRTLVRAMALRPLALTSLNMAMPPYNKTNNNRWMAGSMSFFTTPFIQCRSLLHDTDAVTPPALHPLRLTQEMIADGIAALDDAEVVAEAVVVATAETAMM